MGVVTDKPYVMCRPGDALIMKEYPVDDPQVVPATVADRVNMGWAVRYYLTFDDGVVSAEGPFEKGGGELDVVKCSLCSLLRPLVVVFQAPVVFQASRKEDQVIGQELVSRTCGAAGRS